jgi:hypothetical protein
MYSYTAYGLNIHSEIDLSNLARGSSSPDVQVRRGKVNPPCEASGRATWTTRSDIYFRFQGIGTVQVSDGRAIMVDADSVDDRTAALFVLGPAMGVLLHQRGVLVLHASAVTVNGGVVAFLGHSGWGKSTMAAAMVKLGASAFSDDLVAVPMKGCVPMALPGYPFLKLGLDSGEILGYKIRDISPVLPADDRRQIAVPGADPAASVPLARIYILAEGDQPEVEPLKPQDAAVELIRHSYASPCIKASGMSAFHLKSCAELVDRLPIRRIRRPRRLDLIHEVAELVRRDVPTAEGE